MKIRNGFVSNSSSSSFCILGTTIKKEDLENNFDTLEDSIKTKYEFDWEEYWSDAIWDVDLQLIRDTNSIDSDYWLIGEDVELFNFDANQNKTVIQIKQQIFDKIVKIGLGADIGNIEIFNGEMN